MSDINFFIKNGYIILNIFSRKDILFFKKKIINKLNKKLKENKFYNKIIELENFHNLNISNKITENVFHSSDRYVDIISPIRKKLIKNITIRRVMKEYWNHDNCIIKWIGSLKRKEIKNNVTGFRVVKPSRVKKKQKVAGPHLDIHVGGKICSDKNSLLTLWTPITGFSSKYTLALAPGSHNYDHPLDQYVNNKKIISNIFKKTYFKKFKFKRLNLKTGQVILFHPNLIHGGSSNIGEITRCSLEIRLYNKKNIKKWIN